jgi:glutaredoxin-like protein NrdH
LDKSNIEYSTIDITVDTEAFDKIIEMGFKAAPVVITDKDSWAGFNPTKLAKLVEESI